jgi:hypothetical protein
MENTQLVSVKRMTPGFVENSMITIQSAMEYANILLKSKLCPSHFYEKKRDGDKLVVDYENGKPEAVVLVIQHGMEIGLSVSQSLQQIVPVNGLISLKGDGAKSLIFSSGASEVWDEKESGTISDGTFTVEIYSKRKNGKEKTEIFSLDLAKRAGLYYSDAELKQLEISTNDWQKKKAYAFKQGAWFKYPARMVQYRAIGWMARDLYPDIINGMMTMEEAIDIPQEEGTVVIQTQPGKSIKIQEGKHLAMQERSSDISKNTSERIEKANGHIPEADIVTPNEENEINSDDDPKRPLTEQELADKKDQIYLYAKEILPEAKYSLLIAIPQKKTNKLCRNALLAYWGGTLDKFLTDNMGSIPGDNENIAPIMDNKTPNKEPDNDLEKLFDTPPVNAQPPIKTNEAVKTFESEKKVEETKPLVIMELDENGQRNFENSLLLYNNLIENGINDSNFESTLSKTDLAGKYTDLNSFCFLAKKDEIEFLFHKIQ